MAKSYRPYLPQKDLLSPPSPRNLLPKGQRACSVSGLIDELDRSAIGSYFAPEERGDPPHRPLRTMSSSDRNRYETWPK
jgi:hypothetical protein